MYGEITFNKSGKALTILGEKLELEEVGEPSDLNWQYIGYPRKLIFRNQIIVIFSMTIFLFIILYFSTLFQVSEYNKVKMYPAIKDCEGISSQFEDINTFKEFADYDKDGTLNNHGHGFYQCFCKLHSEKDEKMCEHYNGSQTRYLLVTNFISALVLAINQGVIYLSIFLVERIGFLTESEKTIKICQLIF